MKKSLWLVTVIVLAVGAALFINRPGAVKKFTNSNTAVSHPMIRVISPASYELISSPLTVTGEARGNWFFEATAPMLVVDWDGLIIGQSYIQAQGEWMTENFVPFQGVIEFGMPAYKKTGALILGKSNASGLPEHDDAIEIPIRFE